MVRYEIVRFGRRQTCCQQAGLILCGRADGGGGWFPVCGWADEGTIGVVLRMTNDPRDAGWVQSRIIDIRRESLAGLTQ